MDLKTDRMRGVIVPDYFQKILDTSGGSFLAVLQQYRDTQVQPAYRESLADLLDYNYIRSKVLTGDIVEHTYKKDRRHHLPRQGDTLLQEWLSYR